MTRRPVLALIALVLALTGCSGLAAAQRDDVTVLAAASLTEAFTELGRDFEAAQPQHRVVFSFAGSSSLARQIVSGAPADVFAAASTATMAQVTEAGLGDGDPTVIARNQLVIAVRKGNPERIAGLADLTRAGVTVALCAEQVPCGAAAGTVLKKAAVPLRPVTFELDVRAALAKVRLGEVDAALVYRTDVPIAAAEVDAVRFPESGSASTDYPIVVIKGAPYAQAARAFVDFVRSEPGRAVLTRYGFAAP